MVDTAPATIVQLVREHRKDIGKTRQAWRSFTRGTHPWSWVATERRESASCPNGMQPSNAPLLIGEGLGHASTYGYHNGGNPAPRVAIRKQLRGAHRGCASRFTIAMMAFICGADLSAYLVLE